MRTGIEFMIVIGGVWLASLWYAYTLGKIRGEAVGLREASKTWREAREALRRF